MVAGLSRERSRPAAGPTGGQTPAITILLACAAAYLAARYWIPGLFRGFDTDEYLSLWVTSEGLSETVDRAHHFQGNSPLYFMLLWVWRQVVGASPFMLAIPSLACFVAALWHTYALGRDLDRPEAGLLAAFVLASGGGRVTELLEVRPYGLLMLAVVLSARALLRWLADADPKDGVRLVVYTWVALAMTPFAAVIAIAWTVGIATAWRRGHLPGRRSMPWMIALGVALGALLLPQFLLLTGRSEELSYASMPTLGTLFKSFSLLPVLLGCALGIVAFRSRAEKGPDLRSPAMRTVFVWALSSSVALFVASHLTGDSVFLIRYLLPARPAIAILVAMVLVRIVDIRGRTVAVAVLVALSLLGYSSDFKGEPGWQPAIEWAGGQLAEVDGAGAVLFDLNLVESEVLERANDPDWVPYLQAPLAHHGVAGEHFGLTRAGGVEARRYTDELMTDLTTRFDSIAVVADGRSLHIDLVEQRLGDAGFVRTEGPAAGWRSAQLYTR